MAAKSSASRRTGRIPGKCLASGVGPVEGDTAAEKNDRKMRILDYLYQPNGDQGRHRRADRQRRSLFGSSAPWPSAPASSSSSSSSSSPPCTSKPSSSTGGKERKETKPGLSWLTRFSWGRGLRKKKKSKTEPAEKIEDDKRGETKGLHLPSSKLDGFDSGFRSEHNFREEKDLGIGMGVGMLCLLARWEAEFSKMSELRHHMEMLVKEMRKEVPKRDANGSSEGLNDSFPSPSDYCIVLDRNEDNIMPSQDTILHLGSSQPATANSDISCYNGGQSRMDQMEAELKLELKRLQHHLEGNDFFDSSSSEEERLEVDSESIRSSDSFSREPRGCNNLKEEEKHKDLGVSPNELERRLHELRHARQLERIVELESALEISKRMLAEKDIEISRLRDATALASLLGNTRGEIRERA